MQFGGLDLDIISVYSTPDSDLPKYLDELKMSSQFHSDNLIIAGDLNARSPTWGDSQLNHRGDSVENYISQDNLIICNDQSSPSTFSSHQGSSHIDLTICSAKISNLIANWAVSPLDSLSDHRIITFTLNPSGQRPLKSTYDQRFNINKAKWNSLRSGLIPVLQHSIHQIVNIQSNFETNINICVKEFVHKIITVVKNNIPFRKIRTVSNPWWNIKIQILRNK